MTTDSRTYIIAEAGVNHNGSLGMALGLVDAAADAGVDAVKFQTFRAENLVSRQAPKAEYQLRTTDGGESQFDMIRRLELDGHTHEILMDRARARGIEFLSTPFDLESLDLLVGRFSMQTIKIPSGEITNAPFLLEIAQRAQRIVLSTGMCDLGEVEAALGVLAFGFTQPPAASPGVAAFAQAYASAAGQHALRERVSVLHCTTEYPAPMAEVNLRAMDTLMAAFGLPVGYSDHTAGIHVTLAAVARGARIVEKHFTLDRSLPGPDHAASLEPAELTRMVDAIRDIEAALGDGIKRPTLAEWKNRSVARKSLVATEPVRAGEVFSLSNLSSKRPGGGVSPFRYWELLGKPSTRIYTADEMIDD